MTDPKVKTLRPTVEWVLKRSRKIGEDLPPGIRRVLRFKRLPTPAVAQVIKAVEEHGEFRALVSENVKESDIDRGGFLWLTRPDGWESEFASIIGAEQRHADALREIQLEREGVKSVEALRLSLAAAHERIEALEAECHELGTSLDLERTRGRELVGDLTAAEGRASSLGAERQEAVRQMKKIEELLLRRNREREALLAQLAATRKDQSHQPTDLTAIVSAVEGTEESLDALASAFQEALGAVRARVAQTQADLTDLVAEPEGPAVSVTDARPMVRRREPLALPPGIRDDSLEAAQFLVAAPDATLLIDGYNASMNKWPTDSIEGQRHRLVTALDALAARTSIDIDVVFDGADAGGFATGSRYLGVRVRFSPADIEADDVIIETVAGLPPEQPVFVASDDERVRHGVRKLGANLLTVHQLFGLLR